MNLEGLVFTDGSFHLFFNSIVGNEHGYVQSSSSDDGGDGTLPKCKDSFFTDNTGESILDILVVSAFGFRETLISLHTNKRKITRVSNEGSERSSHQRSRGLLEESCGSSTILLLKVFGQVEIDAHTKSSVDNLTEKSGIKSSIESFKSAFLGDLSGNNER